MHPYKHASMLLYGLLVFTTQAQSYVHSGTFHETESADTLLTIPKDLSNAAGLIVATNMGVWSLDRYLLDGTYSRINLNTVINNFKSGFVWDNDMFLTNLFAHPYQGGLCINAARINGFSFLESVPFAAAGSLTWEFFMENEPAAINDFLATSLGGICFGEITYRISDRIIDDRAVGLDRFKREALIALISPVRGLNRLMKGDAWLRREIRGNSIPAVPITFSTAIGYRFLYDNLKKRKDFSGIDYADLRLNYGDPYDQDNEAPYDYFTFRLGLNFFSRQPAVARINTLGMLLSRDIDLKKPNHQLIWGIFQHFNYYESHADIDHVSLTPYKFSETASFGPGILYKAKLRHLPTLSASAYLSAILLGGNQTDHFNFFERDYNMGSGYSSKLNLELQFGSKVILTIDSENYRIYSWIGQNPNEYEKFSSDVQGDIGNSRLQVATLSLDFMINPHFILGAEANYYHRRTNHKYYPDVENDVGDNKVSVGYVF